MRRYDQRPWTNRSLSRNRNCASEQSDARTACIPSCPDIPTPIWAAGTEIILGVTQGKYKVLQCPTTMSSSIIRGSQRGIPSAIPPGRIYTLEHTVCEYLSVDIMQDHRPTVPWTETELFQWSNDQSFLKGQGQTSISKVTHQGHLLLIMLTSLAPSPIASVMVFLCRFIKSTSKAF